MNAHTAPIAYTLQNAFAASGYIHGPLMRLQWSDRFDAMEQQLAAAWKAEVYKRPKSTGDKSEDELKQQYFAGLQGGMIAKAEHERRIAAVMACLATGPKIRADLMKAAGLKDHAMGNMLSKLRREGKVIMTRVKTHLYLYEVAQ